MSVYPKPVDDVGWLNDRLRDLRVSLDESRRGGRLRTVSYTTSSLANNASETGTLDLGVGFTILNFASSHALRFRAYQTAAHRTADASRAVGVYPSGDHGLIFEDDGTAAADYATVAVGGLLDGETSCPVAITNRSGSTRAVTVTLIVRG